MNFDLENERRVPLWLIAGAAILALWLLFGRSGGAPVISGWSGDGRIAAQSVAGAATAAQPGLTGLFAKQDKPLSTGLAGLDKPQDMPWGVPTDSRRTVLTQGYGVGSHAPAATWGSVDMAIDGNGDGEADPQGSMGAPVYATMSGVVEVAANTWPAGNHIWIKSGAYKVGYSHLKEFAIQNGQTVKRGDIIAYMGSSGQSSGPHLDYQVWKDGVNMNPQDFDALP